MEREMNVPAYLTSKANAERKLDVSRGELDDFIKARKLRTQMFASEEYVIAHDVLQLMRELRAQPSAKISLAKAANPASAPVFTARRKAEDDRIVAAALAPLAAPSRTVASTPPVAPSPAIKTVKKTGLFRECISVAEAMKRTGKTEAQIRDLISRGVIDTDGSGEIPAFQVNHLIAKKREAFAD